MCGRYAAASSADELVEELRVQADETAGAVAADYNVAPTKQAPVVLERVPKGAQADEDTTGDGTPAPAEPVRQLRNLTWGLVPSWSKDRSGGARMINARAETLLDKPAYRKAAATRRCLVPAAGYYEWQRSPVATDTKGRPTKQPFFIHRADGHSLVMAGLYEFWRDRSLPDDHEDAWLVTYTIVTTGADEDLGRIHDRQPLVLDPEHWATWLDPTQTDPDVVRGLLGLRRPGRFDAYPVTTAVNAPRNNGPHLLDPAPRETLAGVLDPMTGEVM